MSTATFPGFLNPETTKNQATNYFFKIVDCLNYKNCVLQPNFLIQPNAYWNHITYNSKFKSGSSLGLAYSHGCCDELPRQNQTQILRW